MHRVLACLVLMCGVAHADGEKVLVLRAEGRADKKLRTRIEGAVLKLAQTGRQAPTAGDVTFGDAAMMVGCKPDEDKCKEEVLGMLAVDEIVTITTTPKPGGIEVAVRRIRKGGATRNAATLVTPDKAEQLDALAPLFGAAASTASTASTASAGTAPPGLAPSPSPSTTAAPSPSPTVSEPVPSMPIPSPASGAPASAPIVAAPTTTAALEPLPGPGGGDGGGPIDTVEEPGNRRLAMYGMAGGGVLLIAGVVFWASASGIEDDIRDAPKGTRAELEHVKDLEAEGDAYATTGNVLAVGGLILGGVSTYFFLKRGERPQPRTARVVPIYGSGNGRGIAITWGGSL